MTPLTEADLEDYPMFPLGTPLLPGTALPMQVFEPRYVEMLQRQLDDPDRAAPEFGIVMIERGTETGGDDDRATVACRSVAIHLERMTDGVYRFAAVGIERLRVVRWLPDAPFPRAQVEVWPDLPGPKVTPDRLDRIRELVDEMRALADELGEPFYGQPLPERLDVDTGLFQVASSIPLSALDRFRVLAAPSHDERVTALTAALDDARSVLKFRQIC